MREESGYRRVPSGSCVRVCLTAPPIRTCRQTTHSDTFYPFPPSSSGPRLWFLVLSQASRRPRMIKGPWWRLIGAFGLSPFPPPTSPMPTKQQGPTGRRWKSHRCRIAESTLSALTRTQGRQTRPTGPNRTNKATSPDLVRDDPPPMSGLRDTPTPRTSRPLRQ